ncbi:hypothetical protein NNC19_23145, partial [Clostridium sp. SHJSY1]|uniref:hypothetical protein n=1 Tax=Clostridium sp. SHJSY1 TaxID=2942483 RepID=UPI0028759BAC
MPRKDIDFDKDPVLFNSYYQASKNYPGKDSVEEVTIKKGSLFAIVQLAEPNGGGDYLIPIDKFKDYELDAAALCQAYQVAPFHNEKTGEVTYKPEAGIYLANEDIIIAEGPTTANPQYGLGGEVQNVMPHGKIKIQDSYHDKEMKSHHPLIPINLNSYESEKYISDEDKRKIYDIKDKYKDSINANGCLDLKNMEVDIEVYKVMEQKNELHENLFKQIGIIQEYSKELNEPSRDLEYLRDLKNQINRTRSRFFENHLDLENQISEVEKNPELTKTMSETEKEHLLKSENFCPEEIKDILKYMQEKMAELESKLTDEEKIKLNISEKDLKLEATKDNNDSEEKKKKEEKLSEIYKYITREGAIEDLGFRSRVYIPQAERMPEALLCNLKAKDELNKVISISGNDEFKKFCSKEIEKLNKEIEKLDKEIKPSDKDY